MWVFYINIVTYLHSTDIFTFNPIKITINIES